MQETRLVVSEVICGEFPECVPRLRGDGFVLRAHGPGDLERIVEQCQDPLAQRFVPLPSPYTHSTAHDFLTGYVAGGWNRREHAEFAIADVSDTYLGSMSLKARDHDRYEIGYLLHPDARGRGLATAAAGLLYGGRLPSWELRLCCGVPSAVMRYLFGWHRN